MIKTLHAVTRKEFDAESMIKAVVYGPKMPSVSIAVDRKEFDTLYKEAGESTVISLSGLDQPVEVLVQEVTRRPFVGGFQHVDFYAVAAGQEVTTHVHLEFTGEAPVEESGGTVNKVMHQVEVTGKPKDLPAKIEVDLSSLKVAHDMIHVSDLKVPKGITIENAADEVVAVAEGERAEEPEEIAAEEATTEPANEAAEVKEGN